MKLSHALAIVLSLSIVNANLHAEVQKEKVQELSKKTCHEDAIDHVLKAWNAGLSTLDGTDPNLINKPDKELGSAGLRAKKEIFKKYKQAFDKAVAFEIERTSDWARANDLGDTYIFMRDLLTFHPDKEQQTKRIADALEISPEQVPALEPGKLPEDFKNRIAIAIRLKRLQLMAQHFNYEALERSITHLKQKYRNQYPKADQYLLQLSELKAECPDIEKMIARAGFKDIPFLKKIVNFRLNSLYYDNPEVDFENFLAVRRFSADGTDTTRTLDRPINYQGITSMEDGRYYHSDILSFKTSDIEIAPKTIFSNNRWIGHMEMDFPGDRIMFTTNRDKTEAPPPGTPRVYGEVWEIRELDLNSFADKCLTIPLMPQDTDSYDSVYLPDGRIIFTNTSGMQGVPCIRGKDWVGNLHLLDRKTNDVRRITFDQDNNWYPTLLHNGRVMYLRWEYTESAHYFSRILMHMNPDGSDQKEYYGSNSYWPNSIFNARDIPGKPGMFIGIVTGHHGTNRVGELVLFDVNRGRTETEGAIQKLPGYGKEVPNITKDNLVDNIPTPYFAEPFPLSENYYLVSSTVFKGHRLMNIVLSDTFDNIVPLTCSSYFLYAEPYPIKTRKKPPVIPDRVTPEKTTAIAYVADIHLGRAVAGIPEGEAKYLRVFTSEYSPRGEGGHYSIGMESNWDVKILYGTVPLNEDGSTVFEVPANEPVTVQVLDKDFRSLSIMRSWFTPMPGETLSCIGCHERQNDAAPVKRTMASHQKPVKITPFQGPVRTFSFLNEMQEMLDRNCISCHNPETNTKWGVPDFATVSEPVNPTPQLQGLAGTYQYPIPGSVSYWSLHPYVRRNGPEGDYRGLTPTEFMADTSELVQILKKGHHGVKLNDEEWQRLYTWIDMNVPYRGAWTGRDRYGCLNETVIERRFELMKKYSNLTRHYITMRNSDFVRKNIVRYGVPELKKAPVKTVKAEGFPFEVTTPGEQTVLNLGNGIEMKFRKIPKGKFVMGSVDETPSEAPMSVVEINKPFHMGETEVTLEQYRQFDPAYVNGWYDMHYKDQVKPGYEMNAPQFPVIRVTWKRAMEFCKWLSQKTGKKVTLPTEAQWEYAARGGTDSPFYFGAINSDFSDYANLADITIKELAVSGIDPKPIKKPGKYLDFVPRDHNWNDGVLHLAHVGNYKPNAFGLYDMIGNVAEWTRSKDQSYPWSDDESRNNTEDNKATRIVRGGSWRDRSIRATSSWRLGYPGWRRVYNVGFRVIIEE